MVKQTASEDILGLKEIYKVSDLTLEDMTKTFEHIRSVEFSKLIQNKHHCMFEMNSDNKFVRPVLMQFLVKKQSDFVDLQRAVQTIFVCNDEFTQFDACSKADSHGVLEEPLLIGLTIHSVDDLRTMQDTAEKIYKCPEVIFQYKND